MKNAKAVRDDLIGLVHTALDAASRPDELLDCARAAAVLNDPDLSRAVTDRLADQISEAAEGSSAWRLQMQQSKHDTWMQTGHKARVLAEAWSVVAGGHDQGERQHLPGADPGPPNYDQP